MPKFTIVQFNDEKGLDSFVEEGVNVNQHDPLAVAAEIDLERVIDPLNEICIGSGGYEMDKVYESEGSGDEDGLISDPVLTLGITAFYFLGAASVVNHVDYSGERKTEIAIAEEFGYTNLIEAFKKIYGEENMRIFPAETKKER